MAEPTVDELIRHLQTELEKCESIIDSQERKQRQVQIENSIQESLSFQQRYKMLESAGIDPLVITETVRLIKSVDEKNQSKKAEIPARKRKSVHALRVCDGTRASLA